MQKNKIFLLLISSLTLVGCTQTVDGDDHSSSSSSSSQTTSSTDSSSTSGSDSTSSSTSGTTTTDSTDTSQSIPEDDCPIDRVTFSQPSYYYVFGSAGGKIYDISQSFNVKMKAGHKWSDLVYDEDYSMSWVSSNTSVMEVSQHGLITKKSLGYSDITATITMNDGSTRWAKCRVELVNAIKESFVKVDDVYGLKNSDQIIIACPEKGKVASNTETGGYLVPVDGSFNADKSALTSVGIGVAIFMIGVHEDYSNVFELYESELDKKLAAKNVSNLAFITNTGNTWWAFEQDGDGVYMSSTSSIEGQMMYNAHDGGTGNKFTVYDSSPQFDMLLPTIYKKINVKA